jgi:hypothetical protein
MCSIQQYGSSYETGTKPQGRLFSPSDYGRADIDANRFFTYGPPSLMWIMQFHFDLQICCSLYRCAPAHNARTNQRLTQLCCQRGSTKS